MQLEHKCRFEFIASQFESEKIVCVRDGYLLLLYDAIDSIPPNIALEYKITNKAKKQEFHWRSNVNQSTYVFFDPIVNEALKKREEDEILATPIIVKK